MAHLKICDIKKHGESSGVSGKRIEFPGAKEKGVGGFRNSKQEVHPLSNELWGICQIQIEQTRTVWEEVFDRKLTSNEANYLPLFYSIDESYIN